MRDRKYSTIKRGKEQGYKVAFAQRGVPVGCLLTASRLTVSVWFSLQNTNPVSTESGSDIVDEEDLASMRMSQLKKIVEDDKIDIDPSLDLTCTDTFRSAIRNHRLEVVERTPGDDNDEGSSYLEY